MEDGDLGDVFLPDSGSSLAMDRRGSKHEDIKMNEEPVEECEETGGNGEKLPEETGQGSHSSSTGAGGGGGSDGDDDGDDDDNDDDDNQDDDDDDYDEDEDDVEQDMQDHERMIADQMDEYEASLGLPPGALSGALEDGLAGYHSGGGESDLIDPPQTFDANGAPLPADSTSSLTDRDRFDLDAALDAAEDAAADAAGLGGGGRHEATLRALQGIMSGMSGRLKGILTTLKNKSADSRTKLASLQDLAELLSVSTEDTLAGYFQTESFVKEIVSILRGDSNGTGGGGGGGNGMTAEEMIAFGIDPDEASGGGGDDEENNVQMMLLACRCLANLMEALPGSAHSVVYAGAVPILCSKLLEIQYIDLAEQTLSVSPLHDSELTVADIDLVRRLWRRSRRRFPHPSYEKAD
jgi:E3 ubiquitin-protein ligase TRIP12